MNTSHSVIQLTGEAVTVSYVADPSVGHGKFRLENRGAVAVTVAVESAWLELGEHLQSLERISVFDLDEDRSLGSESFRVEAGTTVTFLLGFPKIAYEPRFGESTTVGLRLSVSGAEIQALSPLRFIRRIPKTH